MADIAINDETQEEEAAELFITPIRVYRIDDGSLATEADSSGSSSLAYSVGKTVADEDDIAAIKALAGIEPEVAAPENKVVKWLTKKPAKKSAKK